MSMRRFVRPISWIGLSILLTVGCGGGGGTGGPGGPDGERPPAPTFEQDDALTPGVSEIGGIDGGDPRPVARISDDEGNTADFVANELIVMTDDEASLQAFLDRWNGSVLLTIDVPALDASATTAHLVRVDPSTADPQQLASDLRELDPNSRGSHRVSSEAGIELLAASASETAAGTSAMVNWLLRSGDIVSGDTEEHPGITDSSLSDPTNAFTWPYMNRGSAQNIGVGAAWQALKAAGVLDDGALVRIGILDGGFASIRQDDLPLHRDMVGQWDSPNPGGCGDDDPCPWHGTYVAQAAMARVDDGDGVAGPAGPVADALFFASPGFSGAEITEYLVEAAQESIDDLPRIINLSVGTRIPASLAPVTKPFFDSYGNALWNSGVLPVVSAGNSFDNVDAEDCAFGACWEEAAYLPCEGSGFVCVGGLDWDSTGIASSSLASGSNYGTEDPDDESTVNIFGPYEMLLGPVVEGNDAGDVVRKFGTSYASPFVAGVAALVWAANPELDNADVLDILYRTANTGSEDPEVSRWVNAYAAVVVALGGVPDPYVELLSPQDGATFLEAEPVPFEARAVSFENTATYRWQVDGQPIEADTASFETRELCPGDRTIELVVEDGPRSSPPIQRTVTIENRVPEVEITDVVPTEPGVTNDVKLRGTVTDPACDDPEGKNVDVGLMRWDLEDGFGGTGAGILGTFTEQGDKEVTLSYTDEHGAEGTDSTTVTVVEFDPDAPLFVTINEPVDGARYGFDSEHRLDTTDPCYSIPFVAEASSSVADSDLRWRVRPEGGAFSEFAQGRDVRFEPSCFDYESFVQFEVDVYIEGEPIHAATSDRVTIEVRFPGR